jgi:hypothetical protein
MNFTERYVGTKYASFLTQTPLKYFVIKCVDSLLILGIILCYLTEETTLIYSSLL